MMNVELAPAMLRHPAAGGSVRTSGSSLDAALRLLLCVYVATVTLEGPLRLGLAVGGMPNALYLRDAIPALSIAVVLLRPLFMQRWLDMPLIVGASLLAIHALVGLVLGLAPFQVAFGLKIFMYPLYGLAMWPLLQGRWPAVQRAVAVVFVVTLAGVGVNFFMGRLPWEGLEYDTAFGEVTASRLWWQGDVQRLSGFTRASFNAAMILGITAALLMVWLRLRVLQLLVAALAFVAIAVTTSKGMLLAFPVAAAWLLHRGGARHARVGRAAVYALCALGLALPIVMVYFNLGAELRRDGWPTLILSVWDRFSRVWPRAFELLPDGAAGILGAGLGSIGSPQMYGRHPHLTTAPDSVAVLLLVSFGVLGALYFAWPALTLRGAMARLPGDLSRAYVAMLIIAYGYGLSVSMVEESFFAVCIGLALGAAVNGWSPRAMSQGARAVHAR